MNIGTYTFKYTSSCEAYSVVEHQRYNSPLQMLSAGNPILDNNLAYLQGAGGTRVRIDLNDVLWMRELPGAVINKAELVVPFDSETKFLPLDSVNVVYEKSEGIYALTADFARNPGGNFRNAPGYYRFNVTTHVQSILAGEISNTELLMVASPRVAGLYNSLGTRRTLLHGTEFSDDQTLNTRLVITYSY
jgi:hypothetical protein